MTLLRVKIRQLKNVEEIDHIMVSTDCPDAAAIAESEGIEVSLRADELCHSTTDIADVYVTLAAHVQTPHILWSLTCAPFVSSRIVKDAIRTFRMVKTIHGSVISIKQNHDFTMFNGNPINFDLLNIPRSQDLIPSCALTFGFQIASQYCHSIQWLCS